MEFVWTDMLLYCFPLLKAGFYIVTNISVERSWLFLILNVRFMHVHWSYMDDERDKKKEGKWLVIQKIQ